MPNHISFPSIGQFRDVIKQVHASAKYLNVPVPVVKFTGTVKLHGTNFAICRPVKGVCDDIYFQSRERVITALDDNHGSATWGTVNKFALNEMFDAIADDQCGENEIIQIYGEWAGGNIQKGVGLSGLQKSFFVFAIRISEDSASTSWLSEDAVKSYCKRSIPNMYCVYDFPTWEIEIDFTRPEHVQNYLCELTMNVERECPVAKQLLPDTTDVALIGEGVVWSASPGQQTPFKCDHLKFKVKGEKHSSSKVKTLATVDVEKVKSIEEFVEKTVTENRLNQGINKLREMGLEVDSKNTGVYLKWIMGDVFKEEMDTLLESGLTTKEVTNKMTTKARNFYMKQM